MGRLKWVRAIFCKCLCGQHLEGWEINSFLSAKNICPFPEESIPFFYAFGRQVSAKISARSPEKLIPFLSANISAGMHGEIRPLFFSVLFLVAANGYVYE